jgi:hypothetical protein
MENIGVSISNVEIVDNENVTITYENNNIETIPINLESYKKMFNAWLKDLPPFITDKHKSVMRSIILVSTTSNENEIGKLNDFFKVANINEVKAFLKYMRERRVIIPIEKQKWTS